jgi:hypothetical protein
LALNRAVVLRYRLHLENIPLAPSTINVRLAAIRRFAYEVADTGLLSPELVAGIRRVKGVIVDLIGKARHVQSVPIPPWVKEDIDPWKSAAGIRGGKLFRSILKSGAI